MSNSRKENNDSSAQIMQSLCICCCEICAACVNASVAAREEKVAQEAHNRGDHVSEVIHYEAAARHRHQMGDHYTEMKDDSKALDAASGHKNDTCCLIM
jgi:hypothetical protein